MSGRTGRDWVRIGLGGGSLVLGMWGAAAPRSLGRLLGIDPVSARVIGFRDLGSAWMIFGTGGPVAYASRAIFDFGDAVTMRRQRPWIAVGAAVSFLVGSAKALQTAR